MVAGMAMPSKEDLESMANSISKFGAIDASNFGMVGEGITKIGEGLMSFGGGSFIAGHADAIAKRTGATDPVEKFQKFAKIGPGLDLAAKGIDGLGEAMKRFEATMKGLDLAKVDEVAAGMAKIRDAADPGALSKLGGMISSVAGAATAIWGGDKKEAVEAGADAHSIPAMIAETNRLIEQGFITGPSGLFGSPGIGTSAFLMSRQQKKQITTAEEQLKVGEETKEVTEKKSPIIPTMVFPDAAAMLAETKKQRETSEKGLKVQEDTNKAATKSPLITSRVSKESLQPVLKEIVIPEIKPLVFKPVKIDIPKFEDPVKKVRSTYEVPAVESFQTTKPPELESNKLVQKGEHQGESGSWIYLPSDGGWYFESDRKVTKTRGKKGIERLEQGDSLEVTEQEVPEQKFKRGKMISRGVWEQIQIEPLDAGAVTPMYPQTGPALVAGQMEANALAASQTGPTITDASSSTIVNNSNQSMMMPLPDPNPHNMDFHPEHRLFPT